jgi:Flp pilus assembly protein TadD
MLAASILATAAPAGAVSVAPESPGTALSRHIRVLASSPQDFNALIGAGKAALELGDVQAAAGFFGRAEEAYPRSPAPKAGLGAAMAHMGDADGAIFYFDQAIRLGASTLVIALDRGLARDLNGDLGAAQSDYRTAIDALNSDEGRRRLALSLAIARDRDGALRALQPLLNRRDPAAQRTRAFVLALVGDQAGAAQAIESVMPGGSARFAPFFTYLPNLSIEEKAAAVHLGMFPENPAERVAQAQVTRTAPSVPLGARASQPTLSLGGPAAERGSRTAQRPATQSPPVKMASSEPLPAVPAPSFSLPSQKPSASPSFSLPSANSATSTATIPAQTEPRPAEEPAQPPPALAETESPDGNLSGIDKLLATIAEAPPPPKPKLELKKPDAAASKKAATDKKAADKKAAEEKRKREEKLAVEKKAREEAARLGVKGTYWVQLAGGSNQDRLGLEYRRLATKAGSALRSRSGYVTEGKSYFRLLVGPFDSKSESQSFVNKLAKEGVDGFSWTRTPAQIKIEKIASR